MSWTDLQQELETEFATLSWRAEEVVSALERRGSFMRGVRRDAERLQRMHSPMRRLASCPVCKIVFSPRSRVRRHCDSCECLSPRARQRRALRAARACVHCGTLFTPVRGKHLKFCGDACRVGWRSARAHAELRGDVERWARYVEQSRARQTAARRARGCLPQEARRAPVAERYGRWTVLRELPLYRRERMLQCRCACGKERAIKLARLRQGRSSQCASCSSKQKWARSLGRRVAAGNQVAAPTLELGL